MVHLTHPYIITDIIANLNNNTIYNSKLLKVYHSLLFDSAWLCYDGYMPRIGPSMICNFKEFAIDKSEFDVSQFFPGAFAYHLHLRNIGLVINKNSYFEKFEQYFSEIIFK